MPVDLDISGKVKLVINKWNGSIVVAIGAEIDWTLDLFKNIKNNLFLVNK